jgi:hypothetical protein
MAHCASVGAQKTRIIDLHTSRCINSYDRPVPHWSAILIAGNYSITRLISYPEITPLLSAGSGKSLEPMWGRGEQIWVVGFKKDVTINL